MLILLADEVETGPLRWTETIAAAGQERETGRRSPHERQETAV